MAGETGSITSIEIGENHKSVFLALMDVKTTSAQAMQPDWLEAIPGSAKLKNLFSRIAKLTISRHFRSQPIQMKGKLLEIKYTAGK